MASAHRYQPWGRRGQVSRSAARSCWLIDCGAGSFTSIRSDWDVLLRRKSISESSLRWCPGGNRVLATLFPGYLIVQRHEHRPSEVETVLGLQLAVLDEHVDLFPNDASWTVVSAPPSSTEET